MTVPGGEIYRMLVTNERYIVDIKTFEGIRSEVVAKWNGVDFVLIEDMDLSMTKINAGQALNNNVIICSIRKEHES